MLRLGRRGPERPLRQHGREERSQRPRTPQQEEEAGGGGAEEGSGPQRCSVSPARATRSSAGIQPRPSPKRPVQPAGFVSGGFMRK